MAWNRSDSQQNMAPTVRGGRTLHKAIVRGIIVGCITIALGFAVAFWLFNTPASKQVNSKSEKASLIKEVKPRLKAIGKTDVANKEEKVEVIDPTVAKTNGIVSALNPEGRLFLSTVSNSTGMILTTYRRANGSLVEVLDRVRPSVKKTATDQLLDMAINHPNGPPIPVNPNDRSLDEAFKKSLEKSIEIKESDSEAIRSLKERMIAAREDMAAMMNDTSASFAEIIEAHQRRTQENTALLNEAQGAINDCLKRGDKDGAGQIYSQFSGQLERLGITGLTLDPVLENEDE